MRRFRVLLLVTVACLVVLGLGAAFASAGHRTATLNGAAKAALLSKASPQSVDLARGTARTRTVYVYITNTGKKYHRWGCRFLAKSHIKKTLAWVKAHGYKPCSVCKPPT